MTLFMRLKILVLAVVCCTLNAHLSYGKPASSITDVPGVQVGHTTLISNTPVQIRTGVTAVVPNFKAIGDEQGSLPTHGLPAAVEVHSGNGVLTGVSFIQDFGLLNAPIILTNTESVGVAYTAVRHYMREQFRSPWEGGIPVIGECWDGFFNTVNHSSVTSTDVINAIQSASNEPVPMGSVGAGTGMRSFGLHAGIGSASQRITVDGKTYTLGVLLNMNHSPFAQMDLSFKRRLERVLGNLQHVLAADSAHQIKSKRTAETSSVNPFRTGSIVTILATDAPLNEKQLHLLAKRAWLGIGQTGSIGALSSGDFTIAFSTQKAIDMRTKPQESTQPLSLHSLSNNDLTLFFKTAVDIVTEAQYRAILSSHLPVQSELSPNNTATPHPK